MCLFSNTTASKSRDCRNKPPIICLLTTITPCASGLLLLRCNLGVCHPSVAHVNLERQKPRHPKIRQRIWGTRELSLVLSTVPVLLGTSSIESKPPGGYQRGGGLARPFGAWPEAGENHLDSAVFFEVVVQELTPTEGGTNFEETDLSSASEKSQADKKAPKNPTKIHSHGANWLYLINYKYELSRKILFSNIVPWITPTISNAWYFSFGGLSASLRFTGDGRWATFDVVSLWCKNLFESIFWYPWGNGMELRCYGIQYIKSWWSTWPFQQVTFVRSQSILPALLPNWPGSTGRICAKRSNADIADFTNVALHSTKTAGMSQKSKVVSPNGREASGFLARNCQWGATSGPFVIPLVEVDSS